MFSKVALLFDLPTSNVCECSFFTFFLDYFHFISYFVVLTSSISLLVVKLNFCSFKKLFSQLQRCNRV